MLPIRFDDPELASFFADANVRQNVRSLLKYIALVIGVIILFALLFQVIMRYVEGEEHSFITGIYWAVTVMSTLGLGDITFQSDIGRLFSVVVLITGIVMLLIVLPFAFIRFFYAPWLETQIRRRAPRSIPSDVSGHVIICAYDTIAPGLIARLKQEDLPYYVLEEDSAVAAEMHMERISVIAGDVDSTDTYKALNLPRASLVFANREDVVNTNIILTVREVAPSVKVVATASMEDSIDVLDLSGATHVLPLKKWLGEQLANRLNALHAQLHAIGNYEDLLIAEMPIHNTPLAGKTVRETRLREISGVSIIGIWERGRLHPARPMTPLTESSVLVLIGREEQLQALDDLLFIYDVNPNPVLVIGGGKVGTAAVRSLARRNVPVNLIDLVESRGQRVADVCNKVVIGNAADYDVLAEAGIMEAPSVLLTTNDDAMNIYLAAYCRKLNPDLRVVSRITHERNLEAIHRAGADFVPSYASLGTEAVMSIVKDQELVVLGEGVNIFTIPLPKSLANKTLAETEIGARTGMTVIAVESNGKVETDISADTVLPPGSELVVLGDTSQRRHFGEIFGEAK